jgi:hypothetical protein
MVAAALSAILFVYAVDDSTKVDPWGRAWGKEAVSGLERGSPVWEARARTTSLAGARGETVAFQVMVRADGDDLQGVNLEVTSLEGPSARIEPSAVRLYKEWYTQVTRTSESPTHSCGPGWYPDALVPWEVPDGTVAVSTPAGPATYDAPPFRVAKGLTQGVWVDVMIPRQLPAGTYTGKLIVTAENAKPAELTLRLRVWDFELPAERHLIWTAWYNNMGGRFFRGYSEDPAHPSAEARQTEAQLWQVAHDHRMNLSPGRETPGYVLTFEGEGADLKVDWEEFDRLYGGYLDGSAFPDGEPTRMFCLPVSADLPAGVTPETRQALLGKTAEHFLSKGYHLEDHFVFLPDEPSERKRGSLETLGHFADLVHQAHPGLRTRADVYTAFSPGFIEQYARYIDKWQVAGEHMHLGWLAEEVAQGKQMGFYQASEPAIGSEALDGDGLSLRTWEWIAWKYRIQHLDLYAVDAYARVWSKSPASSIWVDPYNQGWPTNSQGVLIYPGRDPVLRVVDTWQVIPSIRLQQIRRGMQDHEYFWMLKEMGQGELADTLVNGVVRSALMDSWVEGKFESKPWGDWSRDPADWDAAVQRAAEAIEAGSR